MSCSILKRNIYRYYLLIALFSGVALQSIGQSEETIAKRDYKVLKTTKDKHGNTLTTVQYYEGNVKITQTVIKPPMPSFTDRTPINVDTLDNDSLLVYVKKSQYLVALIYKRKRIRQYRAVFGPEPKNDKMMEGDRSTPEGMFKIVGKRSHANWQKFILIDYPNDSSHIKFQSRKSAKLIPSHAKIGGSIGIHGTFKGGETLFDLGVGWTDGCVALKPEDINDFYKFVKPGTRVLIRY